jgi:hypothetical protein
LEAGKQAYAQAQDNLLLVLPDKLLKGGQGFAEARKRVVLLPQLFSASDVEEKG